MWASANGHAAVVETLLSRGAEIEARADDGWTALMAASFMGQAAVVETLLSRVLKLRPGILLDGPPLWRLLLWAKLQL